MNELQFSLPADSMSMLVLLYIAVDVCLFVCTFSVHRYKGIFRKKGEKKASRGRDAAQKKNESRQLQASKRKTKTEKLLKHHASNRIPSLSETNNTQKGAITGEEAKKNQTPATIATLSSPFCQQHQKRVCEGERGKSERGEARGERRLKPFSHASS
jgi:hypothetical protein